MMPNYLDTSVLVRMIVQDIEEQVAALTRLLNRESVLRVPVQAVIETVFVLHRYYKYSRSDIVRALQALAQLECLELNRDLLNQVLAQWVQHPKLSFEDVWMASVAQLDRSQLYTFDKSLARQHPSASLLS